MNLPGRIQRAHLLLTGLLWACVLFSLGALPSDRFPVLWLLALTLPACLFMELQKRNPRAFGLGIAGLLQLLAAYTALHLAGPLEQPAALVVLASAYQESAAQTLAVAGAGVVYIPKAKLTADTLRQALQAETKPPKGAEGP